AAARRRIDQPAPTTGWRVLPGRAHRSVPRQRGGRGARRLPALGERRASAPDGAPAVPDRAGGGYSDLGGPAAVRALRRGDPRPAPAALRTPAHVLGP